MSSRITISEQIQSRCIDTLQKQLRNNNQLNATARNYESVSTPFTESKEYILKKPAALAELSSKREYYLDIFDG